jgi:hypothetical protein
MPQPLPFYDYVSVVAKLRATPLLKMMQRSQLARSPRFFWACDVLVVQGIRWVVSQSAVAIELVERKC